MTILKRAKKIAGQATNDANAPRALRKLAGLFIRPGQRRRKGYTEEHDANLLLLTHLTKTAALGSSAEALRSLDGAHSPAKSTIHRHVTAGQTIEDIERIGHEGMMAFVQEYARITGQSRVTLITDEVILPVDSSRPEEPQTPRTQLKVLTKKGIALSKALPPQTHRDFKLREGTQGLEVIITIAVFPDGARFAVQAFYTKSVLDRSPDAILRQVKPAVMGVLAAGLTITKYMLDRRWDGLACELELRSWGIPYIARGAERGALHFDTFTRQGRKAIRKRREGGAWKSRIQIAHDEFANAAPIGGKKNWYAFAVKCKMYEEDPGESTLVVVYRPKKRIRPGEILVLRKNMVASYFRTNLPPTADTAEFVAHHWGDRWDIEQDIREVKQYQTVGGGGTLRTRSLFLQMSFLMESVSTFRQCMIRRRLGKHVGFVRHSHIALTIPFLALVLIHVYGGIPPSLAELLPPV